MKALTVCQPYAHFICLPESHPEHKPIENRTWATSYHGPLLIHAGKSRDWLDVGDEQKYPGMAFGAVVALVDLIGCVPFEKLPDRYRGHKHANGPFCWLLANVRRLEQPVDCMGSQGLWVPDDRVKKAVLAQIDAPWDGRERRRWDR